MSERLRKLKSFKLGQGALSFSSERQALANIRKSYKTKATAACSDFESRFSSFVTFEEAFAGFNHDLERTIEETAAAAASDIAQAGIFHWGHADLREKLELRTKTLFDNFVELKNEYLAIEIQATEREARRGEAGGNQPMVVGGGFGLEGAARGMAIAVAANTVISLAHGAANAAGRAIEKAGDKQRKRELLRDPATRHILSTLLHDIAFEGQKIVAEVLNNELPEAVFEEISNDAQRRAAALAENVAGGLVPQEKIEQVLLQALELNPFSEAPWRLWIDHLGDPDGSVLQSAQCFGIEALSEYKQELLDSRRAALAWETPDQCLVSCASLEETAGFLGLPFGQERLKIEARALALDNELRRFNDVLYPSAADASAARLAYMDVARRTVEGVVYDTHEEAKIANDVRHEQQSRTFRNTIYPNIKLAKEARAQFHLSTSVMLWIGILLAPFPIALITLTPVFGARQKITAFIWMFLYGILVYVAVDDPKVVNIVPWVMGWVILDAVFLVLTMFEVTIRNIESSISLKKK